MLPILIAAVVTVIPSVTPTQMDVLRTQLQASIPQLSTARPAMPSGAGAAGTSSLAMPADAVLPSPIRGGLLTTSGTGTFATTFAQAYAAPPVASLDPYTKGVTCDLAVTTTGLSGTCYTAIYNTLGGAPTYQAAAGVTVAYHLIVAN